MILDKDSRIIAVLVGWPKDRDRVKEEDRWAACAKRAAEAFDSAREENHDEFREKQFKHQRGDFTIVNVGIFVGMGATMRNLLPPHGTY